MSKISHVEAFPLHWPIGYKRSANRTRSRFKVTMDASQRLLQKEVSRLGGKNLVVSTNIPVRKDGGLYADWMNKRIDDPGVAIYFRYQDNDISMCCDQYERIWENVYALAKGIEALRSLERWGVSDFLQRAFTGFAALPEAKSKTPTFTPWYITLEVPHHADLFEIKAAFRRLSKLYHPDAPGGGNIEKFQAILKAYREILPFNES